jgi:hypothetical protein
MDLRMISLDIFLDLEGKFIGIKAQGQFFSFSNIELKKITSSKSQHSEDYLKALHRI